MSVNSFTISFAGHAASTPRIGSLYAPNNTLAQIAAVGFLDNYIKTQSFSVLPTDFIAAVCSDGHQWYKPVFTAGSCQLTVLP